MFRPGPSARTRADPEPPKPSDWADAGPVGDGIFVLGNTRTSTRDALTRPPKIGGRPRGGDRAHRAARGQRHRQARPASHERQQGLAPAGAMAGLDGGATRRTLPARRHPAGAPDCGREHPGPAGLRTRRMTVMTVAKLRRGNPARMRPWSTRRRSRSRNRRVADPSSRASRDEVIGAGWPNACRRRGKRKDTQRFDGTRNGSRALRSTRSHDDTFTPSQAIRGNGSTPGGGTSSGVESTGFADHRARWSARPLSARIWGGHRATRLISV
jgi:hypothetical protein